MTPRATIGNFLRSCFHLIQALKLKFIEANIHEETAALAHGYDAICAFVNADLGAPVIEELHRQGVKLILMRCAGYNNVDLETTAKCGIQVARVPRLFSGSCRRACHALALACNRRLYKAYNKVREMIQPRRTHGLQFLW